MAFSSTRVSGDFIQPAGWDHYRDNRRYTTSWHSRPSWSTTWRGWGGPSYYSTSYRTPVVTHMSGSSLGTAVIALAALAILGAGLSRPFCETRKVCDYLGFGLDNCHYREFCFW